MIFAVDAHLVSPYRALEGATAKNDALSPYRALEGATAKNDALLEACVAHPERFLASPRSGDPRLLVAAAVTDPDNAAWEVWRGPACCGIILLDRIVPAIDARWQFVFFDDDLASRASLLQEFARRCWTEAGLARLTLEIPDNMTSLLRFARNTLGAVVEGVRERAYYDREWRALTTLRVSPTEAA
jgi:hypothetical protein